MSYRNSKRKKIPYKKSKRSFTKNASRTHKMNTNKRPLRGGTRL